MICNINSEYFTVSKFPDGAHLYKISEQDLEKYQTAMTTLSNGPNIIWIWSIKLQDYIQFIQSASLSNDKWDIYLLGDISLKNHERFKDTIVKVVL